MFSGRPKYQNPPATEDYDEDDDEVEGVEMPPPKGSRPARSEEKPSFGGFSRTLDFYWQKKSQRETTPTTSIPPALGETREQHRGQLRREQQPIARKTSSPARNSPLPVYPLRKVEHQEVNRADGGGPQVERPAIVVQRPTVSRNKANTVPRPSTLPGRRDDDDESPFKPGGRTVYASTLPFSKRDLLRQFEESESDLDSDQIMVENSGSEKETGNTEHNDIEEMNEDSLNNASCQEDEDEETDEDEDDESDELIGIGSRRIPGFSQNPPPRQPGAPRTDESSDDSEEEGEDDSEQDDIGTPTKVGFPDVDITPRRSMANRNLLQEDPEELERQDERAKQEIVREVLTRHAEVAARTNFDIIVTMPDYEDVADYLFNPDEWEAFAVDSRWTSEDGHVSYKIMYKDGHFRVVEGDEILDHVDSHILEEFENDLFAREENPETWYYPSFKAPGGVFAGGTGITSGVNKRRGRRSEAKIFLDNCYRLGMPEELNIPMADSSDDSEHSDDDDNGIENVAGARGPILASQYNKFGITDAEILATIRENESDNESWDGGRKSGRGRPRGRPSTSTRAHTMIRPTRAAAKRGRGRPPLTPTRANSTSVFQTVPATKSNVVKASATSRGRGRPRGSKNIPRMDSSASSREDTPLSFSPATAPVKLPSSRGRPRGSKNVLKPVTSNPSESSSLSDFPTPAKPITPVRPISVIKAPSPNPFTKPAASGTKRMLKPTRAPKPPGTPSGARGPGRPPKAQLPSKPESDLIEETIRTGGANIKATSASHRRTLSATSQASQASLERPKKRRRIRFGIDGPEEVTDDDFPGQIIISAAPSVARSPRKYNETPRRQLKPKLPDSGGEKSVFSHEVDRILNKMLLDGAPAYHVQLHGPGTNKPTMWVRLENLQSKDAKRKVKEFEADLIQRERDAKLVSDRISAQLQRDTQRLAEREAQILGKRSPGRPPKRPEEEEREDREYREKEERRQRERIARRLAMQETLFAGT